MKTNQEHGPVLVCVTAQSTCLPIIEAGKKLAQKTDAPLMVISVQPANEDPEVRANSLQRLYDHSKPAGADIMIYYNDEPALTVAAYAKVKKASHIVTGMPGGHMPDFVDMIRLLMEDIPITMVWDQVLYTMNPSKLNKKKIPTQIK